MSSRSNDKLKIGFVLDDSLDKPDGVQQYVLSLGKWLREQGHDVHYLVSSTLREDIPNVHSLGRNVRVRFNGNRLGTPLPAKKSEIRILLQREQFDVLHVQMPHSPVLAQRVVNLAGPQTAVIGTFHIVPHGFFVRAVSKGLAVWTRSSLRRFDRVVSVSTAAQAFADASFHLHTTVLPNVVDYDRFRRAKPLTDPTDKLTVVFLGRLVPRKGCRTLLQAVDIIAKRRQRNVPGFRVLICGKGPLLDELQRYVHDHQLESMVTFEGFLSEDDKPRYLQTADIAVFPSTGGESFGIVLIEAMAAGAMVLGGDNAGYRSVLGEHPDLLFKPRTPSVLADKLSYYLSNSGSRHAEAQWGISYAKQFATPVVGQKLLAIYNEALHARRNVR